LECLSISKLGAECRRSCEQERDHDETDYEDCGKFIDFVGCSQHSNVYRNCVMFSPAKLE
jgi:hypothetical protein